MISKSSGGPQAIIFVQSLRACSYTAVIKLVSLQMSWSLDYLIHITYNLWIHVNQEKVSSTQCVFYKRQAE